MKLLESGTVRFWAAMVCRWLQGPGLQESGKVPVPHEAPKRLVGWAPSTSAGQRGQGSILQLWAQASGSPGMKHPRPHTHPHTHPAPVGGRPLLSSGARSRARCPPIAGVKTRLEGPWVESLEENRYVVQALLSSSKAYPEAVLVGFLPAPSEGKNTAPRPATDQNGTCCGSSSSSLRRGSWSRDGTPSQCVVSRRRVTSVTRPSSLSRSCQ